MEDGIVFSLLQVGLHNSSDSTPSITSSIFPSPGSVYFDSSFNESLIPGYIHPVQLPAMVPTDVALSHLSQSPRMVSFRDMEATFQAVITALILEKARSSCKKWLRSQSCHPAVKLREFINY